MPHIHGNFDGGATWKRRAVRVSACRPNLSGRSSKSRGRFPATRRAPQRIATRRKAKYAAGATTVLTSPRQTRQAGAPESWRSPQRPAGRLAFSLGAVLSSGEQRRFRPRNGQLYADEQGTVHVGLDVLAKKPLSVWLRALGKGAEKASNWETSSGSFEYTCLPAILLPDAQNSCPHATMLMEFGSYVNGNIYQAMMGEKSRDIKFTSLIAEGEDYEQVGFEWLVGKENI